MAEQTRANEVQPFQVQPDAALVLAGTAIALFLASVGLATMLGARMWSVLS